MRERISTGWSKRAFESPWKNPFSYIYEKIREGKSSDTNLRNKSTLRIYNEIRIALKIFIWFNLIKKYFFIKKIKLFCKRNV